MLGSKKSVLASVAATIVCLLLFLLPFPGLEFQAKGCFIVFIWAVLMWIFRPIPEYLVGIFSAAVLIVVFGVKGTLVTAGFSNLGWWLTVWATFLGGVLVRTGLGYRLAYWVLVKLGTSHLKCMYATNIASTILSAVMPSNTARGAIFANICDNICAGMGYEKGSHAGDHGLMLSNLYTNTTNTWLFFTATGANAIAMGIVVEMTGKNITWMGWLVATCLPALVVLLLIPLVCYKLFPPKDKTKKVDVSFAQQKLAEMGPMSHKEKSATVIILVTLVMWATEGLHGIGTNYVAFFMAFALLFPKYGPCTYQEIGDTIPWPQLIQLGFAMGLAGVVASTGGFQWLVDSLFLSSAFVQNLGFLQLMMIWLPAIVFLHIIFAGMNAMVAVMVPVGITLATTLGFDPFITGLMTTMAISAGAFFMPFNSAPNLVFYGTGRFTVGQELKGAIPIAILIVLGFFFSLTVWWPLVGIM